MKIYLTAILKSKPEFVTIVKAVLENMVIQSRKETACLQYDLHQGIEDETLFVFYEIWQDKKGLDEHNQQPYIKAFSTLKEEQLESDPIVYITHKL